MATIFEQLQKKEFEGALETVQNAFTDLYERNEALREENARLKSESYKDSELAEMQERLDQAIAAKEQAFQDAHRGFPITEQESQAITDWIHDHEIQHGSPDGAPRNHGAIGGGYTYSFIPTSIGVLGQVSCGDCGESFTFQDLF